MGLIEELESVYGGIEQYLFFLCLWSALDPIPRKLAFKRLSALISREVAPASPSRTAQ